ncbi:MAG: hypothetical protein O2930_12020 [Acidobacteria bacterium]|nr:hypothetical protein [Acidobacteriota bacterium]
MNNTPNVRPQRPVEYRPFGNDDTRLESPVMSTQDDDEDDDGDEDGGDDDDEEDTESGMPPGWSD